MTSRIDPDLAAAALRGAIVVSEGSTMRPCGRVARAHATSCRCCRDVSNRRRPGGVAFFALY